MSQEDLKESAEVSNSTAHETPSSSIPQIPATEAVENDAKDVVQIKSAESHQEISSGAAGNEAEERGRPEILASEGHTESEKLAEHADADNGVEQREMVDSSNIETEDNGDLSVSDSAQAEDSTKAAPASHRRFDSVPPQKYDLSEATTSMGSMNLAPTIEEESDISLTNGSDAMERGTELTDDARSHSNSRIDKAELQFEDIRLDGSGMLDPDNPLAGASKTADQIRQDSFSNSNPPKSPTTDDAETAFSQTDTAGGMHTSDSQHSAMSDSLEVSISSEQRKSVEGRYRGRRSRPSSRTASPSRSPITSQRSDGINDNSVKIAAGQDHSSGPTPILLTAADEDGNISSVSVNDVPVSPRTVTATATSIEEEVAAEDKGDRGSSKSDVETGTKEAQAGSGPESQDVSKPCPTSPNGEGQSQGPGLSDKADLSPPNSKGRRKSSSANADSLDSRTRMQTLPAKSKAEEIHHRVEFEKMMLVAKEAERKRQQEEVERKRRKADEQREALARWEKEILPSWTRARKDPELGELWCKGAPPSIRGRVWALAIGNPLMLPRNLLELTEKKANLSGKEIPPRILEEIEDDVETTLPSLKLFQQSGPLHDDLVRICRAFVLVRMEQVEDLDSAGDADKSAAIHQAVSPTFKQSPLPDVDETKGPSSSTGAVVTDSYAERGIELYQKGLAVLSAILLINLPSSTSFICLLNLIHNKPWLKALYSLLPTVLPPSSPSRAAKGSAYNLPPKEKSIRAFERVLETLLADQMPKVYANLLARNVKLYQVVLRSWVGELWGSWLDIDTVMRLWDAMLLDETDGMLYRICLALVQTLESRLYVPEQSELESILNGTNKAALSIWRRDKQMSGELSLHVPTSPRATRTSFSSSMGSPRSKAPELSPADKQTSPSPLDVPQRTSSLSQPSSSSGETQQDVPPESILPRDYIYEQYGIKEDHIFDTLNEQKGWWKQSTLERLLDRELAG